MERIQAGFLVFLADEEMSQVSFSMPVSMDTGGLHRPMEVWHGIDTWTAQAKT